MAGGDTGATIKRDVTGIRFPVSDQQLLTQLTGREKSPSSIQVALPEIVSRAGNMPGDRVDGLLCPCVSGRIAGIQQQWQAIHFVQPDQHARVGRSGESGRLPVHLARLRLHPQFQPRLPAAIQDGGLSVPQVLQHPPQSAGDGPAAGVVHYDLRTRGYAKTGKNLCQSRRRRQWMPSMIRHRDITQMIMEVRILGTGYMALQVIPESRAGILQFITAVNDNPIGRTPGGFKFPRINQ
jgi:hypothetical protein